MSFYAVPSSLRATHGNYPISFQLFVQFRPRLSAVAQPKDASALGWDFKAKKEIEGKATTATVFNPAEPLKDQSKTVVMKTPGLVKSPTVIGEPTSTEMLDAL